MRNGRRAFSANEGADALAGDDESFGAQRRHRLAHHRAAHPGRRDQLLLGRQAGAGRQLVRS